MLLADDDDEQRATRDSPACYVIAQKGQSGPMRTDGMVDTISHFFWSLSGRRTVKDPLLDYNYNGRLFIG